MEQQQLNISIDYAAVFRSAPFPGLLLLPDAPLFTILEVSDSYLAASRRRREDVTGIGFF